MAIHKLQLDYNFKGDAQLVYQSVLDMRLFGKYHPYMTEVNVLQTTHEFTEFDIKENVLLFGFIPMKPRYTAKSFEVEKGKHIKYTSPVNKGMDLIIDFHFTYNATGNTTSLVENIELTGNSLSCKILSGVMKKAHGILFKEIEKSK
jgi:hypothetical protein